MMIRKTLLVAAMLIASCTPLRTYRQQPEVKAWDADIRKFEQTDRDKFYPEDAVLFAGSSSIRLWETINKDMLPYNVIQRGYGGAKLSDFAVYASRIIYPHNCQAIVIFVANDITGSQDDKTPQQVASLFRRTLYIIRRKFIDTPVFWISITPTESRWKVWPEIRKANLLIKNICYNHRNTYYINTELAFLNSSGMPRTELFQDDELHLNPEGYKVWAGIIKKELNKVLMNK